MTGLHGKPTNIAVIEPPVYGCKRHPWRWGVAHTRRIGDELRTWITGEYDDRKAAERELAKRIEWHGRERVSNPATDDRLLEPTEPWPVYRSVEAVIEAAPLKPVSLYEWECPLCGCTLGEYHGDYSAMDAGEAVDLYREHLSDHRLPFEDDLATCKFCGDEFDVSKASPCRESSEECEPDD